MIGLCGVAVSLGPLRVPVQDLPEWDRLTEAERDVAAALGIDTVAVAGGTTALELVVDAADRSLVSAGIDADDVDALLVIPSRAPDLLVASEATRVQAAIGARRAVTFGVGDLGCASIGPGLLAARALLLAEPSWRHVMIVHACVPPPGGCYRHPVTFNGTAGAAVVVARTDQLALLDAQVASDGRYWDLYSIDYRSRDVADWVERCRDVAEYSFRLAVESRNRFREQSAAALGRAGLTNGDVAALLMQNLSVGAHRFYEDAFGFRITPSSRENLRSVGHLGPIDVLLNLLTALEVGEVGRGDHLLLFSNSPAAAWSTAVLRA